MLQEVYQITAGGLLHDIGKVIFRAQSLDGRAHSRSGYDAMKEIIDQPEILRCIRYHHKKDIGQSRLEDDDWAFLVYVADNIASGADRRDGEEEQQKGFDKTLPLESVFNLMNNNTARRVHQQGDMDEAKGINLPKDRDQVRPYTAERYNALYQKLHDGLRQIDYSAEYIDSLLALLEGYLTYVPSSTNKQEIADISLYDHCKMTAALAACLYLYLAEAGRRNFRQECLTDERKLLDEEAFLMLSCDLSGIQPFIYTTSGDGALKSLRARSLYLEILLENVADEILQEMGLSRAHLIYTGGGHAYLLAANTKDCRDKLSQAVQEMKQWFIDHFDHDLYLAIAWQPCSGNDLMNKGDKGDKEDRYRQIFGSLTRQLGAQKSRRYTARELQQLNRRAGSEDKRECKECKRSADLQGEDMCTFCSQLKTISAELIKDEGYFAILAQPLANHGALPLPHLKGGDIYLQMLQENDVRARLQAGQMVRFYGKNKMVTGKSLATKIWMGDYHVRNEGAAATFEQLADQKRGIKRIGVLRADVDNLGQAFASGLMRDEESAAARYMTISRTATLSRSLSMFFKYHLNAILANTAGLPMQPFSLDGTAKSEPRQVNIIYSGGDDLFLVGAWQDIIECAVDIQKAFALYTQNTLTISAGVGIFSNTYPLIRMAEETGALEDKAKSFDGKTKNALALFGGDSIDHCYHWQQFEQEVVNEKLRFLQKYLGTKRLDEQTNTAFVYQLLELLRHADEQINLARFAYHLARHAETLKDKTLQQTFCDKMYAWYLTDRERGQLMTAIYLYIYLYR